VIGTIESVQHHQHQILGVDIRVRCEVEIGRQPSARTEDHFPQHGAALESDLVHNALLRKELEQVGEDHVDFDMANVSGTGAAGYLAKLVRCQHGSPLAPMIRGTSASRWFRRAYTNRPHAAT
jgi:hypothetical protein